MGYFPAFIKLDNKRVLLVGGGRIALEKLEKLVDFTSNISVISLEFSDAMLAFIHKHALSYEQRSYKKGEIADMAIVVVAVDDIDLQKSIYEESQNFKCLCNAVDSVEYCDFIFPSYIKEGDLSLAISTSGASPAFAKHFKAYISHYIPSDVSVFLSEMKGLRLRLPKGKERMQMLDAKAKDYIQKMRKNEFL